MAFSTILITASLLVAVTHALLIWLWKCCVWFVAQRLSGFVWQDDDDDDGFGGFQFQPMSYMYGPPLPAPPALPNLPGFNLPRPPRLPMFMPPFHMPTFHMPTFTMPPFPTADDIKNTKPKPGQSYDGVFVSSHSNSKYDEDGKLIKNSGGTILVNNNGDVIEEQFGNQPTTDEPTVGPIIVPMVHMPSFVPFRQPFMKPLDPNFIRNAVPKGNENYKGSSVSSHSFTNIKNGKKTSGGGINSITNDNGKVDEELIEFSKKDD